MLLLELKKCGGFGLIKDLTSNIPSYYNEEVTFKDVTEGSGKYKAGYRKIQFCGEQAARNGLQHL